LKNTIKVKMKLGGRILCITLVTLAACSTESRDPGEPGVNKDSQTLVQNNIEYRAESLFLESFPVQVVANVEITNQTSGPVTLTFPDGCLVVLRVYRDAQRTQLAYDMARDYGCTQALVPVTVRAGESKQLSSPPISAAKILGDSLPNGTYYFSALVRANGQRLELRAGSGELAK
jgi:hypothetical protein